MKEEKHPSIRKIMDALVDCRIKPTKPEDFSNLFVRMAWLEDHKKMHVIGVFEDWLRDCKDPYRIEIVLKNEEFFPFIEDEDFYLALNGVRNAMPDLDILCDQMAKARKSQ